MEETILYNVPHEIPWQIWIPFYFYFTGLSAGSFILSSLSTVFGMKKYKPLALPSAITAVLLLILAPLCLILDLSSPFRFWHTIAPLYFNPTATVSYGAWLLTIYPISTLVYIWFMYIKDEKITKIIGSFNVPLAISVHAYTGFVFGVTKARPWWNSSLMPGYFLTSAILSGIGLLIIIALIKDWIKGEEINMEILDGLCKMMIGIILIDLFWVLSFWIVLGLSVEDGRLALQIAFHEPLYVVGELLIGMIVPLFLLIFFRRSLPAIVTTSVLVLFGVFLMRYTLVFTAYEIPLD